MDSHRGFHVVKMREVNPLSEQFDAHLGMAKRLRPELEEIDGFVDNARNRPPHGLLALSRRPPEIGEAMGYQSNAA